MLLDRLMFSASVRASIAVANTDKKLAPYVSVTDFTMLFARY